MTEEVTVDVAVEIEVDTDELEMERDDAELIEATYRANGVEIEVEAHPFEGAIRGADADGDSDDVDHADSEEVDGDDEGGYEDYEQRWRRSRSR